MSFEQMMAELTKEYVATLPEKIKTLEDHWTQKNLTALHDEFHKLKGTGKTYGIPEISELGEWAEKTCLTQPDRILSTFPTILELLKAIHSERTAERPFALTSDHRYAQLIKP